jgi:hypothetical protein
LLVLLMGFVDVAHSIGQDEHRGDQTRERMVPGRLPDVDHDDPTERQPTSGVPRENWQTRELMSRE